MLVYPKQLQWLEATDTFDHWFEWSLDPKYFKCDWKKNRNTIKFANKNLTLKRLGKWWGEGCQFGPLSCGFLKILSSKRRVKLRFFVTFKIIIRHIFLENLTESSPSCSEFMENLSVSISYFHQFLSIFWILWHFFVSKKLMMSAFFHFQHALNRLFNNYQKFCWSWISSSWNMKGGGGSNWQPQGKTTFKKPILIKVKDWILITWGKTLSKCYVSKIDV